MGAKGAPRYESNGLRGRVGCQPVSNKKHRKRLLTPPGHQTPNAPDEFSLDLFAKQNGATELELDAMKAYFSVDENTSRMFMEQFYNYLTVYEEARAKEATSKVLEAHAELQHELTAQAKAAEKSTGSGSLPA